MIIHSRFGPGTTSSRGNCFNHHGIPVFRTQKGIQADSIPNPDGWNMMPMKLWSTQGRSGFGGHYMCRHRKARKLRHRIPTVNNGCMDKQTGKPINTYLSFQDRRTCQQYCDQMKQTGHSKRIQQKHGLIIDHFFSN